MNKRPDRHDRHDRHERRDSRDAAPKVHPDFDGHLAKPLERMTVDERLAWIEEGMRLLQWRDTQVRTMDVDDSSRNE